MVREGLLEVVTPEPRLEWKALARCGFPEGRGARGAREPASVDRAERRRGGRWVSRRPQVLLSADPAELSSGETEELQRIKWHRQKLLEDIQASAHAHTHTDKGMSPHTRAC